MNDKINNLIKKDLSTLSKYDLIDLIISIMPPENKIKWVNDSDMRDMFESFE